MERLILIGRGYGNKAHMGGILESSKRLLEILGMQYTDGYIMQGSYWGRLSESFLSAWAELFLKAAREDSKIVALEEDSYLDALYFFNLLRAHSGTFFEKISKAGIAPSTIKPPIYLPAYALEHENITGQYSSSFKEFRTAWIGSVRAKEPPNDLQDFHTLLSKALELKILIRSFSFEGYAHTFAFNPKGALQQSARIYLEAVDLGSDFITVNSGEQLGFLDFMNKKMQNIYGRKEDTIPLLHPVQLILLALGERDKKHLGIHKHKIKVSLI